MSPPTRLTFSAGDVGRREDDALQRRALEVLDVAAESGGDAISVGLAQLLRPGPVADVELAAGVALDASGGKLLQLDPDDPRAVRRARRIDRHRLAAGDGRLRGKEAALGLVDGARDTVEAGRDVHDRRATEALVAVPVGALAHRDVDLHRAAAVAEALGRTRDRRRDVSGSEQLPVELRRRHSRDDRPLCADRLAAGQPDSGGTSTRDEHALDLDAAADLAARVAHDPGQAVDENAAAALRDGHPAELQRAGDHLGHEARGRLIRPEPRVEHPRREQAVRCVGLEGVAEPVAAACENAADVLEQPATTEATKRLSAEAETRG